MQGLLGGGKRPGGPDMEAGHQVLIKPVLREGLTAKAQCPLLGKTGCFFFFF